AVELQAPYRKRTKFYHRSSQLQHGQRFLSDHLAGLHKSQAGVKSTRRLILGFVTNGHVTDATVCTKDLEHFLHPEAAVALSLKLFVHHQADDESLLAWMLEIQP